MPHYHSQPTKMSIIVSFHAISQLQPDTGGKLQTVLPYLPILPAFNAPDDRSEFCKSIRVQTARMTVKLS